MPENNDEFDDFFSDLGEEGETVKDILAKERQEKHPAPQNGLIETAAGHAGIFQQPVWAAAFTSPASFAQKAEPSFSSMQAAVNRDYQLLYEHIKQAQEKAGDKKLIILVGEDHFDRNSLLVRLMVGDIARRLGIRDIGIENSKQFLPDQLQRNVAAFTQISASTSGEIARFTREYDVSEHTAKILQLLKNINLAHHDISYDYSRAAVVQLGIVENINLHTLLAPSDTHFHPCDENVQERMQRVENMVAAGIDNQKILDALMGDTYEAPIANSLLAVIGKRPGIVGCFGLGHLPGIKKNLEANPDAGIYTCCIDAAPKRLEGCLPTEVVEAKSQYYRPNICDSATHPHPANAFGMAEIASLAHRKTTLEISEAVYQKSVAAINAALPMQATGAKIS